MNRALDYLLVILIIIFLVMVFWASSRVVRAEEYQYGIASWYSETDTCDPFPHTIMANGKEFDDEKLTCASWDYEFGTLLNISHAGKSICVTVTDRGPSKSLYKKGRIIDLSRRAFSELASLKWGLIKVRVEKVEDL